MSASTSGWCPDRGDGTYQNPVLLADYSDPDAIRVGEDYWLTSSSFSHVPGLPILHSRDLVNWTLANHALPALVPAEHFSQPRHGGGVWAPSIRHHAGKFWIFYADPDFGIYFVTAEDPRGAWSAPTMVKAGKGLIDPCPLWDDDGASYLVHGWAKSRSGIKNRITLHRLAADYTSVADAGEVIIDGDQMPGWETIEGPKFYKRAGYYYIFAPAGGVTNGYQAVFRARALRGPYENRIVLTQGTTAINGPHQGAWVDTPSGEHGFLHFQEIPVYGRIVHLQPMRWGNDDWPVMGDAGQPVIVSRKPGLFAAAAPPAVAVPATSDEFDAGVLGRQWQWQANPQPGWASLTAAPGILRLSGVPAAAPTASKWTAGNLLLQKFPALAFTATTALRFAPATDGAEAGLIVFGFDYTWIGLRREGGRVRLVLRECRAAQNGGAEREIVARDWAADAQVFLRVTVSRGGMCRFSASTDGVEFTALGEPFQATSSFWVGAKCGLFASAPSGSSTAEHADFDWFRVG